MILCRSTNELVLAFLLFSVPWLATLPVEPVDTLTFWQHRSLNRKRMEFLTSTISTAPRVAIYQMKKLPANARPTVPLGFGHGVIMAWLEWLFIPGYYIWVHSGTIAGGLPGLLPAICVCRMSCRILQKLLVIGNGVATKKISVAMTSLMLVLFFDFVNEAVTLIFVYVWVHFLWPFVPAFLCDFGFYLSIYIFPIIAGFQSLAS